MARLVPTTADRRRPKQQSVCERDDVELQTRITLCFSYKGKFVNRLLVYGGITADWRLTEHQPTGVGIALHWLASLETN